MKRPFAPAQARTFPFTLTTLVCVFISVWILRGGAIARSDELDAAAISDIFRAGNRLRESNSDQDWLRLVEQVHCVREAIEQSSPHVPYVLRNLADGTGRRRPMTRPSGHADLRFVAKELPVPSARFIGQSVFVVNGDLHGSEMRNGQQPLENQDRAWKGCVVQSILVVDGSIEMQGYIVNSIVIAKGPLEIKKNGYIANSLVIVTAPSENNAKPAAASANAGSISLERGYLSQSIVVGDVESAIYINNSRIFGRVSDETKLYRETAVHVPDEIAEVLR